MSENLSEKIKLEIQPNFSVLIYWLKILVFLMALWLGLSSSSFLLLALVIISIDPISQQIFKQRNTLHTFRAYVSVIQACLSTFVSAIFLFGILKISNVNGVLIASSIALIVNFIIYSRLEHKKFSLKLIRDNSLWLITLVASLLIIILGSSYQVLDLAVGFGFIAYLLTQTVFRIRELFSGQKPTTVNLPAASLTTVSELSEIIETKILALDNVCNLHDFEIIDTDNVQNVTGHVVVKNTTTQEQIFETKDRVKTILKKEGFDNSTIEFEYKLEFEQLVGSSNSK
ncbi:MAG: hypothetical protein WCK98_04720 [bacterium]